MKEGEAVLKLTEKSVRSVRRFLEAERAEAEIALEELQNEYEIEQVKANSTYQKSLIDSQWSELQYAIDTTEINVEAAALANSIAVLEQEIKQIEMDLLDSWEDYADLKEEYEKYEQIFNQLGHEIESLDNINIEDFEFGKVNGKCGQAAFAYIAKSIELANTGKADAVATTPINKESLRAGDINFIGHTEIFGELTNTDDPLTMFETNGMRIFFLTRHVSLRDMLDLLCTRIKMNNKIFTKEQMISILERMLLLLTKKDGGLTRRIHFYLFGLSVKDQDVEKEKMLNFYEENSKELFMKALESMFSFFKTDSIHTILTIYEELLGKQIVGELILNTSPALS